MHTRTDQPSAVSPAGRRPDLTATSLALALAVGVAATPALAGPTQRVSVGQGGMQANKKSIQAVVSADGRVVAFTSEATNLLPAGADQNGTRDIFVRDLAAGVTRRVSRPAGGEANAGSSGPSLSADGRFVAFESFASNLVPDDTNRNPDVFIRDRKTNLFSRVNVGPGGVQANGYSSSPSLSADGRLVAFVSNATNLTQKAGSGKNQVYVRDRTMGVTTLVSASPGGFDGSSDSFSPSLSADGRFVAFVSYDSSLVAGDINDKEDVLVRDRKAGVTKLASVGPGGVQGNGLSGGPAISADGRFVAFTSSAKNLVSGDTNGEDDVFVRDLIAGTTKRVSVGPGGAQANGGSFAAAISADGRVVAFVSRATNLAPGDTGSDDDMFVRDLAAGTTERVSVGPGGVQGNGDSSTYRKQTLSASGRQIVFDSDATNLVLGDTNGKTDVFIHTR